MWFRLRLRPPLSRNGHAVETPSAASPVLLWRFGLLALALGLTTGDTNVVSTSSSPTIEPPQNYSLYTRFLFAITLVSAVCSYIWSLCQKPTQPRVESTELASYGESNSAYLPSMDEEQQCQTPSPTDDSSGMGGPVTVAPAPTLGDIVVGAAVDGAVRGAVSGAIGGPHHGPSSTDRMLENQQRQDERQIDKQATEIEALKKELDQLKAEKK
eukprot:TRINITY_DN350_c0_g1_i1.p1 TRINITY_DN350_c0_g1~~TRINITY_DN350_c0_g1_i1.p1  ORF type:complete len:213 (-),score=31.24 TRINITY_DN350_c0_g1_i1:224-862(-)